jgi:hypothetical protein
MSDGRRAMEPWSMEQGFGTEAALGTGKPRVVFSPVRCKVGG